MKSILVDTGPLVAWFDRNDRHHKRAKDFFAAYNGKLITTWPVITEVSHLIPQALVCKFLSWIAAGGMSISELPLSAMVSIVEWIQRYPDQAIDIADASLCFIAEHEKIIDIATLDHRHFSIFRINGKKSFRICF